MGTSKPGQKELSVSASELAQMGVCERLVVFEHRLGKRWSLKRRRALERGLRAHERFVREQRACPELELKSRITERLRWIASWVVAASGWLGRRTTRWLSANARHEQP